MRWPASNSGVHRKLLFGFLTGALLLVAMAFLSLVVIRQMNDRTTELDHAQVKASRAQKMLYAVTAQSHYRAMALLVPEMGTKYNGQVEDAKATFVHLLDLMEQAEPANAGFYEGVRNVNAQYAASGRKVLALFQKGGSKNIQAAIDVHIAEEHRISHVLEDSMTGLIAKAQHDMDLAQVDLRNRHIFFTRMVIAFSATSVIVALVLGFVLSWAFILPVRKMERALAEITAGNFDQHVEVPEPR